MGKTIALNFAREGADLILVARTGDELKLVAKECEGLGVQALPLVADVGKHEEVNNYQHIGPLLRLPYNCFKACRSSSYSTVSAI